jgi:hypothetical protein
MSRSFIGRMITTVAVLGGLIGTLLFVVSPALAGNHERVSSTSSAIFVVTQAPTITPAPTPTPGNGTDITAAFQIPNLFIFLLILLAFGLLVVSGLLFYIYKIQGKYYAATQSLSQRGVGVKATLISSILPEGVTEEDGREKLKIDGPGFVAVGTHADYIAKIGSNESSADTQWTFAPEGAVGYNTQKGPKVTVTPLQIGSFRLSASVGGETVEYSVAVVPPQATQELPFIGQGFGSLVIAVLVIVALILLGVTGVLNPEAVGTLLGGLLGYIFGVTTSTAASQKTEGKSPGSSG